jgi:hypothetical protein
MAKSNIDAKILGIETLKDRAIKVPPTGVKNKGVKQAIPQMPNFFHIFTAKRVRRENNLGVDLRCFAINVWIKVPKNETIITVDIIPIIEQIAVSHQFNPNNIPAIGPLKNLIAVANMTVKYFANGMINELFKK